MEEEKKQEEQVEETKEEVSYDDLLARVQALEETLQESKKENDDLKEKVHSQKVTIEKIALQGNHEKVMDTEKTVDDILLSFSKYN